MFAGSALKNLSIVARSGVPYTAVCMRTSLFLSMPFVFRHKTAWRANHFQSGRIVQSGPPPAPHRSSPVPSLLLCTHLQVQRIACLGIPAITPISHSLCAFPAPLSLTQPLQVPAGAGARCDTCLEEKWGCSWTPDGLELLCNGCADKPRYQAEQISDELNGYGQFTWAHACDCNTMW